MSINVNVGNNIPAEVIEVGQEISVNQLAAITSATSPSAVNPFTTLGHTHVAANITDLEGILALKSNTSHTHVIGNITGLQTALDAKAIAGHIHNIWDVTDLQTTLDGKALLVHTHAIADTTGLQTALDGKSATTHLHTGVYAPATHSHAIADTTGLQTALDSKASTTHNHNGTYAPFTHTHAIADVTGLQTAIDGKLNLSGGTMTGGLVFALSDTDARITFNDGSIQSTSAYSKAQTDSYVSTLTGWINGKADLAGATFSGEISAPQIGNLLNQDLIIDAYNDTGAGTHYYHKFTPTGGFILAPNDGYVQAGQYSLSNQGFASYWFYQGDIGRSLKLNQSGLTWDVTKNFNYVLNVGFTFNDKVTLTNPTVDNPTINIGSVASTAIPANALAGDVWLGTWQLCYKTNNGTVVYGAATNQTNVFGSPQIIDTTHNTNPALRVTQKGTGQSIIVEDSTTPDSTSFVVSNNGCVGIGVDNTFVGNVSLNVLQGSNLYACSFRRTSGVDNGQPVVNINGQIGSSTALYVKDGISVFEDGGIKISSFGDSNRPTINRIKNVVTATGTYNKEIPIVIEGIEYRIPCRQV